MCHIHYKDIKIKVDWKLQQLNVALLIRTIKNISPPEIEIFFFQFRGIGGRKSEMGHTQMGI